MPNGTLEEYRMFYFGFDAYKNNSDQPPQVPNDSETVPAYDDFFKQPQTTNQTVAYRKGIVDAKNGKIMTRKASEYDEEYVERKRGFNDRINAQIKKATDASNSNTSATHHLLITSHSNINSTTQNNISIVTRKRAIDNKDSNIVTVPKKSK